MAAGFRSLLAFWTGGASVPGAAHDTINIALIPEGGCPGDTAISLIIGVPNSAASQFTAPVRQSLQIGVPVGARLRFGERRQRPHVDSV